MAKRIITGILLGLVVALIGFFYYGMCGATAMYGVLALGFIVGVLITYFLTWLLSKLLIVIVRHRPLAYYTVCFLFSVLILVLSLNDKLSYFATTEPSFLTWMAYHMTVVFLIIPQMDGEWNTYLVTETTYLDDVAIDSRSYISREYTSGTAIKFGIQIAVSVIACLLLLANKNLAWISFAVEGGCSLYIVIRCIIAYVGAVRSYRY